MATKKQRTWALEELTKVLSYMSNSVREYGSIEKPTSAQYYKKLIAECKLAEDFTAAKLVSKLHHQKKKFLAAVRWSNETGQGVLEGEGEISFQNKLQTKCPLFNLWDEIWGKRASCKVLFVSQTTAIGSQENAVQDENLIEEFNAFLTEESNNSQQNGSETEDAIFKETSSQNESSNSQPIAEASKTPESQSRSTNVESAGKKLNVLGKRKAVAKDVVDVFVEYISSSQKHKEEMMKNAHNLDREKFEFIKSERASKQQEQIELAKINLEIEKIKLLQKQAQVEELKLQLALKNKN